MTDIFEQLPIDEIPLLGMIAVLALIALAICVENYPKRPSVTGSCKLSYAQAKCVLAAYHSRLDTLRMLIAILAATIIAIVVRTLMLMFGG